MTDNRTYTPQPEMPGQSFEEWVRQQFEELARISQEGGQLSPLSIDLDNLADGHVVKFDATNELWTAGAITVPSELPPPDGDYGAVTVTGGVWSINADTVTYDMMQDATQECVIGAAAAGTLQELTIGTGLQINAGALEATSSGSKIIRNWQPTDASFPASGYATLDIRNTHPVLDFPRVNYTAAYFRGVIPDNYDGEDIDVALYVAMTSATSGNIQFAVRMENLVAQDLDSNGFTATYPSTVTAVSGTSGVVVESVITMAGANLDAVAAGNPFRIEVTRHTSSRANDTATGDAELLMVEMRIA
jgi:hypothetical protein